MDANFICAAMLTSQQGAPEMEVPSIGFHGKIHGQERER